MLALLQGCAQKYSAYTGTDAASVTISNGTMTGAEWHLFSDPIACQGPLYMGLALKPQHEAEVLVQGNQPFSVSLSLNYSALADVVNEGNTTIWKFSVKDSMACSNALTFTPLPGEKYKASVSPLRLHGQLQCSFEVTRLTSDGTGTKVPTARLRKYYQTQRLTTVDSYCEDH